MASLSCALLGIFTSDHLGRRSILVLATALLTVVLALAMACSAVSGVSASTTTTTSSAFTSAPNAAAAKGAIAFLIILGGVFAWGYSPIVPIYPGEVLANDQRSAGMGLGTLVTNLAGTAMYFGISIGERDSKNR